VAVPGTYVNVAELALEVIIVNGMLVPELVLLLVGTEKLELGATDPVLVIVEAPALEIVTRELLLLGRAETLELGTVERVLDKDVEAG